MTDMTFNDRMKAAEEAMLARRGAKPRVNAVRDRTMPVVDASELRRIIDVVVSDREAQLRHDMNLVIENALDTVREHKIVLEVPNQVKRELNGLVHKQFETLVKAAAVRDQWGNRKNILLKGPMGGGKSTACKQAAELLGLPFGYIGQTNMPHIVVGSKHPLKDLYNHTAFTRIFMGGGVIVFEEMDAWHPNASLVLNPPLANGWLTLEDGSQHQRHPDCIIVACANTWGTGATAEYVGRNKLDDAFLDRFAFKMMWEYDDKLERMAAANDEVVDVVQQARRNAQHYGIKVAISPRSSIDIADMVRSGFTIREAMKMNFLASVNREIELKLLEDVDV